MMIFRTRYLAEKEREIKPYYTKADIIVKVEGGYTIMNPSDYAVWRKQR